MAFLDLNGLTRYNNNLNTKLSTKAEVDGAYEGMTVGNAEQLISTTYEEDSVPYNFRTSGGSADIGDREFDEIVGGTLAWNQLVNTGDTSVTVISGHKYFSKINDVQSIGLSDGSAISINDASKDNVIDLTLLFGSAVADYIYSLEQSTSGSGVAWFKKLFPKPYYAYNSGELMSVDTSAHRMVGFNQWDEKWENGIWDSSGQFSTTSTAIACKNKIRVLPSTRYYFTLPSYISRLLVRTYDANENYLGNVFVNSSGYITTGSDCYYITFCTYTADNVTSYDGGLCINLSWSGYRNGEYEAYQMRSYPLADITLRGIPKLDADNKLYYDGDTYESDGTVTRRYGVVDLGTLTWQYYAQRHNFYVDISDAKIGTYLNIANISCSNYVATSWSDIYTDTADDKSMAMYNQSGRVYIKDTAYSDAQSFKTAMSGVMLVYELATPTTETADTYQSPQIVDDFGTEEYVDSRDVQIPVGHNTKYTNNLRDKIQRMADSPSGNGDYVLRQTDGENTFVPLVNELPSAPSDDGTYVLKVTVNGSSVSYSWVAE